MNAGDSLPEKLSLKPSKLKWAVVLLISLAFVLLALFVIPPEEDPMMRWLAIGFFGLGVVASIPGLLGVGGLELDREGFTISAMGRKSRRTWRECSEFSILKMRGGAFVGFSSETDAKNPASGISRGLTGETGMLPDKYGMKAGDLADLMNRFRARAAGISR